MVMNMQNDLTNLLEVSYSRGFNKISIEFNSDRYQCVNCTFDSLYVDKTGLSVVTQKGAIFIPFNNILNVEVT